MKIANLFEDVNVLKEVQELTEEILRKDPGLKNKENEKLTRLIKNKFTTRIEI